MPNLLTVDEAAAMCRKTPAQMRWLRHKGIGPRSGKLGGRIVYRREDIEDWIEAAFAASNQTAH